MSNTATLAFSPVEYTLHNLSTWVRPAIIEKAAKLNKHLAKLGAPEATVEFGPVVEKTWKDEFGFEHTDREFETVTVTGFEAKLAGFTSVASLDHTIVADEALVTKFPGRENFEIPASFRTRGPVCDHCGQARNRNLTILLRADDFSWVQVGTSCVLEFLGVDPSTILWLATRQFSEFDGEFEGAGRRSESPFTYLAVAAEVTTAVGFVPTKSDDFRATSTRDTVNTVLFGSPRAQAALKDITSQFDVVRGEAAAASIIEWVQAQPATSDFIISAQLAVRAEAVSHRTQGLLACLPYIVAKNAAEAEAKAAEETLRPSEFIAKVGDKVEVTGTVITAQNVETDFGTSRLLVIRTDEGDKVGTFGSGNSLWSTGKGDRVTLKGTIKELKDDPKWGKETRLTRVKVTVVAEAA